MIVKLCKVGSQPRRLIDYLGRTTRPNAFLLDGNVPGSTPREWASWITDVNGTYRSRKKQFVKHFVLSYATGEHRPNDEMREAVRFFLQRMGYGEAPYVAFLHKDTDNHHVHLVTTPTTWEGQPISEAFDKLRSVRIAREIEDRWNLVRVEAPEAAFLKSPSQGEMKRAAQGEESMRAVFQVEVAQVARDARTLSEFLATLRTRGFSTHVLLDKDGELRGISFSRDGVAFKGSQLGRAFRAGKLLSTFQLAYDPGPDREQVLRLTGSGPTEGSPELGSRPRRLRQALQHEPDGAEDLRQLDRRPDLPARQLVSLDWLRTDRPMPGGSYIVLPLSPQEVAAGLAAGRGSLARRFARRSDASTGARRGPASGGLGVAAILVWRIGEDQLARGGLSRLTRRAGSHSAPHGFEPASSSVSGERYDLWLRSHQALSQDEERPFRQGLADRFGIAEPRGLCP